ncbi:YgjP-like metallopeptidase domain-containing protein [Hymenobacter sp. APR13]|uniref:YgjP-like metallopeptidase domain-containing protein n=1 Tax=Hymenobacter sp. APR13 TaxID=1356852 RepID=UPI0009DE7690
MARQSIKCSRSFSQCLRLIEPNHSRRFYRRLATILPDWKHRKERLEKALT